MSKMEQRIVRLRARADELVGARALELDAEAQKRRQAIAAAIDGMLEAMAEADRLDLFRRMEAAAPARARRIILQHPMRPASLAKGGE